MIASSARIGKIHGLQILKTHLHVWVVIFDSARVTCKTERKQECSLYPTGTLSLEDQTIIYNLRNELTAC